VQLLPVFQNGEKRENIPARWLKVQLDTTLTMVGQTCRFAPISPPASAAMLAEHDGDAHATTSLRSFWWKFGRRGSTALPCGGAELRPGARTGLGAAKRSGDGGLLG